MDGKKYEDCQDTALLALVMERLFGPDVLGDRSFLRAVAGLAAALADLARNVAVAAQELEAAAEAEAEDGAEAEAEVGS